MTLRNITEEEKPPPEVGRCGNLRVAVGYSEGMKGYYVRISNVTDSGNSVFVLNRSESGYLAFIGAAEFLTSLHRALDTHGMYLEGDEQDLAKVVSDLTVQLMEKRRNEQETGAP